MKIERLRKSHKKEIIIGVILTVVIGGALTFRLTHSKYRYTQSIDLAEGVIHYKVPDFQIIAMYQQKEGQTCTEDSCYDEITGRMPSSGYIIDENKSYCTLNGVKDEDAILKTISGNHVISNLIKGDKCYLYFVKVMTTNELIAIVAAKSHGIKSSFNEVATTNEGIFQVSDGMYGGISYYWRGAVNDNHVIFANQCWRIIRINGDGTLRMI